MTLLLNTKLLFTKCPKVLRNSYNKLNVTNSNKKLLKR